MNKILAHVILNSFNLVIPTFPEFGLYKSDLLTELNNTWITTKCLIWPKSHVYIQRKAHACVVILSTMVACRNRRDEEEKNCWIKSLHKKYSRSFVKLRLNHWCHINYLQYFITTFLCLECVRNLVVYGESQKALEFYPKYLNLSSKDERRSDGFGMTWRWVINDRFELFLSTIPST